MIRANHRVNTTRSESRVVIVDNAARQCSALGTHPSSTPAAPAAPAVTVLLHGVPGVYSMIHIISSAHPHTRAGRRTGVNAYFVIKPSYR